MNGQTDKQTNGWIFKCCIQKQHFSLLASQIFDKTQNNGNIENNFDVASQNTAPWSTVFAGV